MFDCIYIEAHYKSLLLLLLLLCVHILLLMFCDCDRCDVYFKSVCEYADIVNAACGMYCRQCDTAGAGLCDDGQCYSGYTMANDKTCHG